MLLHCALCTTSACDTYARHCSKRVHEVNVCVWYLTRVPLSLIFFVQARTCAPDAQRLCVVAAIMAYSSKFGKGSGVWGKGVAEGGKPSKGKGYGSGKSTATSPALGRTWNAGQSVSKIAWNDRVAKWLLRPYATETGSPFGFKGATEMEYLRLDHLGNVLSNTCSEYHWRTGFAMSEGGATIEAGAKIFSKYFKPEHGGQDDVRAQ